MCARVLQAELEGFLGVLVVGFWEGTWRVLGRQKPAFLESAPSFTCVLVMAGVPSRGLPGPRRPGKTDRRALSGAYRTEIAAIFAICDCDAHSRPQKSRDDRKKKKQCYIAI